MELILIIAIFLVWLVLSIVSQFGINKFKRNVFSKLLLPEWRFFSPQPLSNDMNLFYRDKNADFITQWKPALPELSTRFYNFIYNPNRRIRKTIIDSTKVLSIKFTHEKDDIHTTIPYLVLLFYITSIHRDYLATETQFAIVTSSHEATKNELVFSSYFHNLE